MNRQCHFSCVLPHNMGGKAARLIALSLIWLLVGCSDAAAPVEEEYLLRVGDQNVGVQEFEQALEISKVAYPPLSESKPELLAIIRQRLLVEMIEELLIFQRAEELGIEVSESELEARVEEIRADYPDDAFEQIFVQQAVSFELWKRRTRDRLLLNKVIAVDLTPRSALQDSAAGQTAGAEIPTETKDSVDVKPSLGVTPTGIPNEHYEKWIRDLAGRFPVDVNAVLWKTLYGS